MAKTRKRRDFGAVRQLPSGRWQASYLGMDGLRRTAPSTFHTKADAHAWLTVRQSELLRGEWLDPDLGRVPLDAYATKWITEHRLSPRTRDLYEGLNRLHIRPFLGSVTLGALTTERIRRWRAELLRSDRSEVTAAKAYRLLRAILNTAVDDGRISHNPCRIKGADQERAPERPVATVAQVFALADAVGSQYRAFVLTAALTSMRWRELIALRRRDVDLDSGLIFVHRSLIERGGILEPAPPKNNSVRIDRPGGRAATAPGTRPIRPRLPGLHGGARCHPSPWQLAGQRRLDRCSRGGRPPEGFPLPRSAAHGEPPRGAVGSLDP
jgi:hypothetical protein